MIVHAPGASVYLVMGSSEYTGKQYANWTKRLLVAEILLYSVDASHSVFSDRHRIIGYDDAKIPGTPVQVVKMLE